MAMIGKLFRFVVDTVVLVSVLLYLPWLPPFGEFKAYTVIPPPAFEGPLAPQNFELNRAEKLFINELEGPEGLEESPGEPGAFYSGIVGGAVVKFFDEGTKMKPVAKFGGKCAGTWDAAKCGRPAGMRFDKDGRLVVADVYLGIFRVDFKKGSNFSSKEFILLW